MMAEIEVLEPSGFPVSPDDPLAQAHRLLQAYLQEAPVHNYYWARPKDYGGGRAILESSPEIQVEVILAYLAWRQWSGKEERILREGWRRNDDNETAMRRQEDFSRQSGFAWALSSVLFARDLPWTESQLLSLFPLLEECAGYLEPSQVLSAVECYVAAHSLTEPLKSALETMHVPRFANDSTLVADAVRVALLLDKPLLQRSEEWARQLGEFIDSQQAEIRTAWRRLLMHCTHSDGAKPSRKWLAQAKSLMERVGTDHVRAELLRCGEHFGKSDLSAVSQYVFQFNSTVFKGMVWLLPLFMDAETSRFLGRLAGRCFKKVPGIGVQSSKVGNACLWVLSQSDETSALAQLAILKAKATAGTVQKAIQKALDVVATRWNIAPEDLEELLVADYGLEAGVLKRTFGESHVEVDVSSGVTFWTWHNESGKEVKAAPASVKREYATQLKELKAEVAELEKTITAQKERLDSLLRSEKTWPFATWHERYLEHPLLQLLARRIVWTFEGKDGVKVVALPTEYGFINAQGKEIEVPHQGRVALWHPLFSTPDEVLAWRCYFEDNALKQPFKQAHREIYLLTDAERSTEIYSNRFAAHILKQHQFHSLCGARGWKDSLRLIYEGDDPPPTKAWPNSGIRAEFWVEGIGDDYGNDSNETGTYLRLVTDQVRFYPLDAGKNAASSGGGGYHPAYGEPPATPLKLEEIPPLVFSETMRDVDLFVGVASVGADPTWQDGGPNGRFLNYWQDYSFGELSESAKSRADVLSRLLPRLKIRDVASINGRFLRVQGKLRAYKIHLGSGNILMEPNDQYLCIVPSRESSEEVLLPFEGDRLLTVVLSKAFLLAQDDKIKDDSIARQITPS